jgi:hypothetical protein
MMNPWIGYPKPPVKQIFIRWQPYLQCLCIVWILGSNPCQADSPETTIAKDKRPNILFILVDDQSPWDLKAYNPASKLDSPVLDRLARQGMVIDGAYHMGSFSGAVCTPSRHMIMSGRTLWHLPISPKVKDRDLCPPKLELQTIPAVFNRAR